MDAVAQYNAVDFVLLAILLTGLFTGWKRGLSGELAGLISAGAALFAGWYYYQPASEFLLEKTRLEGAAAPVAAFVGILAGAWLAMLLLRLVLRHLMEFTFRGNIERIGGALAGLLKYAFFASALILLLGMWPNETLRRVFAENSMAGRTLADTLGPVYEELSEKYPVLKLPAGGGEEGGPSEEEPEAEEPPPLHDVDE